MPTIRLTMAQALTRWMAVQSIRQFDGSIKPAFAGVWAIFGHGNVAGLGEALHAVKDQMPTFRGTMSKPWLIVQLPMQNRNHAAR